MLRAIGYIIVGAMAIITLCATGVGLFCAGVWFTNLIGPPLLVQGVDDYIILALLGGIFLEIAIVLLGGLWILGQEIMENMIL
jgi:hypothetical protein